MPELQRDSRPPCAAALSSEGLTYARDPVHRPCAHRAREERLVQTNRHADPVVAPLCGTHLRVLERYGYVRLAKPVRSQRTIVLHRAAG